MVDPVHTLETSNKDYTLTEEQAQKLDSHGLIFLRGGFGMGTEKATWVYNLMEGVEPSQVRSLTPEIFSDYVADDDDGEPKCSHPHGHKFVYSDEDENVGYCEHCGCGEY